MINIEHFTFNAFQTQCFVVWDKDGHCAFIDPGAADSSEKERLTSFVASKGLTPVCIILTHGHFDHIYGMADLVRRYGIPVYVHRSEAFTLENTNPYVCSAFGLPLPDTFPLLGEGEESSVVFVAEGDEIKVGELSLEVIETPGHTTGGICCLERKEKVLFSGDTLFAGAIGRTDHPGGNYDLMMKSILGKLMTLDGDITVFPGHGPQSDIATERMTNPFLMPFNEPYEE